MKSSTLIIKKTTAISLFLVSSVYAMELPIEYSKDTQKSFKAQLMAGKIDECLKYIEGKIEGEKEKNRHCWTLAHEALTCINRPGSLLNILNRIEALLHDRPNSCELIHLAAQYNDLELLKYLKENHTAVDLQDGGGATPLFYAAHGNALETMKLLKHWGANINARTRFQLLKDLGADINARTRFDETPLHYAAKSNAIGAMELLKHWGSDSNAKNDRGDTPLHYAAVGNAIEAMKLLKNWGADSNAKNWSDVTPFHYAAKANAIEAMKLLKDWGWGADSNAKNRSDVTPLHYAAEGNAIEAMKLLKHWGWGADMYAKTRCGETPLDHAAWANAIEAMRLLKHWGLGPDMYAKSNWLTALSYAIKGNAIEAMKLLKDWGADINAKTSAEKTPLHYAAEINRIEHMMLLVRWGANIEEKEMNGNTALALAIRYNEKESMDFLCFLGANKDLVNTVPVHEVTRDGLKSFKCICKINQMEPSQSLDDKDGMKLLREAVGNGLFCSVRSLLSLGQIKGVNQKNDAGYTILHEAVDKNKIYVVKILLTTPEIETYSRSYGTMENCPTCKAQTPYDKILKTHPGKGCEICGSQTPYDLAGPEIKEIYHEMRERIAIICCLKKLGLPKELAYILFRLCNFAAKRTHLPKGLFHKALKVQEEKQNGGEEKYLKFEAQRAETAREQQEAQAMMAAVLGD